MSGQSLTPSEYLKYLPALYGLPQKNGEQPLVASYLKIFEKLLSGISEPASHEIFPVEPAYLTRKGIRELLAPQVIGTLFHPRLSFLFADDPSVAATFTPPLSVGNALSTRDDAKKLMLLGAYIGVNDVALVKRWLALFLDWIAGTVALGVDQTWGIDTKRFVIAQALPLFRARGTIDGMAWLLNAWFGLDPDAPVRLVPDGTLKVVRIAVSNLSFAPIRVCDSEQADAFVLEDDSEHSMARLPDIVCYEADAQSRRERAVGYKAWYFIVSLIVVTSEGALSESDQAVLDRFKSAVAGVVDEFKPALTDFDFQIERVHLGPPLSPPDPGPGRPNAEAY